MPDTHPVSLRCFTHNIISLRRKAGLSKKAMAALLHISIYSLNQLEKGQIPPRMSCEVLLEIHQHFHVSPNTMLMQYLDQ